MLGKAKRWAWLRERCGPGVFALLPEANRTFVEQTLTMRTIGPWVEMIGRFNRAAVDLAPGLWRLIEPALHGAHPHDEVTLLESWSGGEMEVERFGDAWLQEDDSLPEPQGMTTAGEIFRTIQDEEIVFPEVA